MVGECFINTDSFGTHKKKKKGRVGDCIFNEEKTRAKKCDLTGCYIQHIFKADWALKTNFLPCFHKRQQSF